MIENVREGVGDQYKKERAVNVSQLHRAICNNVNTSTLYNYFTVGVALSLIMQGVSQSNTVPKETRSMLCNHWGNLST